MMNWAATPQDCQRRSLRWFPLMGSSLPSQRALTRVSLLLTLTLNIPSTSEVSYRPISPIGPMSYPLFPQRRKLRKWIFALPRVRQQIVQRAIGNRLAPQIDKRAIDKGIARKSPFVPSVPLSLHTRLLQSAFLMSLKSLVSLISPRRRTVRIFFASAAILQRSRIADAMALRAPR